MMMMSASQIWIIALLSVDGHLYGSCLIIAQHNRPTSVTRLQGLSSREAQPVPAALARLEEVNQYESSGPGRGSPLAWATQCQGVQPGLPALSKHQNNLVKSLEWGELWSYYVMQILRVFKTASTFMDDIRSRVETPEKMDSDYLAWEGVAELWTYSAHSCPMFARPNLSSHMWGLGWAMCP